MATLSSELDAVNSMLGHIGEMSINSLSDEATLPMSASTALNVLREVSKEVQSEGWHFNTLPEVTLSPNVSNEIELPTNILLVDANDSTIDTVQRGNRLFDRKNNTFTFTKDIKTSQIILLDWTDLIEQARRYITLKASRIFQGRMIGSKALTDLIARDEFNARADLTEADSRTSDRTIFDSYDVAARIGINRNYDIN